MVSPLERNTGEILLSDELFRDKTIALLAPGQGSQKVGMTKDLTSISPKASAFLQRVDEIVGYSLTRIMFEGQQDELTRTVHAQPAIIADAIARRYALEDIGQFPSAEWHAGNSLGLLVGLFNAGSLTDEQAVRLASERGKALQYAIDNSAPTTMTALIGVAPLDIGEIQERFGVSLCLINTEDQRVIGGYVPSVRHAEDWLREKRYKDRKHLIPLTVNGAFHSKFMKLGESIFKDALDATKILPPNKGTVIGNFNSTPLTTVTVIKDVLLGQLTTTDNWAGTIKELHNRGVVATLELGGDPRLTNMNRSMFEGSREKIEYASGGKSIAVAHWWRAESGTIGG
jgi:[acyl-carrier-protein] S-malonyltransferase